ncbi:transposase [Acinetobacter bereziniae]|uniref:transposase n=1 Tax=Acinetobacter TaxID=469 RepID=UPI00148F15A5|nr:MULTISPECIES: transposase [Acinetobacter]MBJ9949892.1 transposase [Acinetobacter bereziniae]MDQ9819241.1 transposase [Acinetobacter bereziniae]NUF65553.1 transposase [Acinetobacter bereziniae]NUG62817.1 transposase [Acinetobacter bereziniae]NUG71973.1 transposase [Acinetobacter bereziniae]
MIEYIVNLLNGWMFAKANNGEEIEVKVIPLKRKQNNVNGVTFVEVGKKIQLTSGQECLLNIDGKSFYTGLNQLYKLIF